MHGFHNPAPGSQEFSMNPIFSEQIYAIFDAMHEAVLMVDAEGVVTYINPSVRMMRIKPEHIVGKLLREVRKGSHLPEVVKTGEAQIGVHRQLGGSEFISNIVPIFEDGKIVGGHFPGHGNRGNRQTLPRSGKIPEKHRGLETSVARTHGRALHRGIHCHGRPGDH